MSNEMKLVFFLFFGKDDDLNQSIVAQEKTSYCVFMCS